MEPTIPNKITTERKSITAAHDKSEQTGEKHFQNFIPIYLIFIRCETAHEARTGETFRIAESRPPPNRENMRQI